MSPALRRLLLLSNRNFSGQRKVLRGISIQVTPNVALVDQPVQTIVSGLLPRQRVTLQLRVTDAAHLAYSSLNHYQASDSGIVDLHSCPALSGPSKDIIEPMAVFWTMKPEQGSDQRFWSTKVEQGLQCSFAIFDGHLQSDQVTNEKPLSVASNALQMRYMNPGVRRIPLKQGRIRGTLFLPEGPGPFRSVINLYGGIHRGQVIEDKAALFATRGLAAMSLAFFGVEDLPKTYASQPMDLDYFEEAVDFLLAQKQVDRSKGVGLCGMSKGGEICLLMAAFLGPKVSSVATINSLVHSTLTPAMHKGQQVLPGHSFDIDENSVTKVGPELYNMLGLYRGLLDDGPTVIPIYNSSARFLFLAGTDDQCCISDNQATLAVKILAEKGKTGHRLMRLPGAGHLIDLPYLPPTTIVNHVMIPKPNKLVQGGDDVLQHGRAQVLAWKALLQHFLLSG